MGQSLELRHKRVEAVTFDESARARDANPDSGGSARATERSKPTDTQPSRRSDAASARFARRSGSRPAVTDVAWDAYSATRAVRRARDPPRGERGRSADADDRGRLKRGKRRPKPMGASSVRDERGTRTHLQIFDRAYAALHRRRCHAFEEALHRGRLTRTRSPAVTDPHHPKLYPAVPCDGLSRRPRVY